ncbi:MAG: alpha/beta hydrolase [Candidatus Omnitrophica bacterium]|nr:hypothetical protein [bacterium]NUN95503.1 alpha/beta hydrolase [Candidatus Omnitrophota bacterium]
MAIQSWRSILRAFPGFIIVLCALSLNGPIQAENLAGDTPPPVPPGFASSGELMRAFTSGKIQLITPPSGLPEGVTCEKGIKYGSVGDRELLLDLYSPKGLARPTPVIIFIHGGGWKGGARGDMAFYCVRFAEKGYITATISYRFSQDAKFPGCVEDAKCAVRFLRANASKYHIDPERIVASGNSAGGYLSMMMGYTSDVPEFEGTGGWNETSSKVRAVINFYGPTDLTTDYAKSVGVVKDFIGKPYDQAAETYKHASPLFHVTKDDPPTLTFQGTIDDIVPVTQADALDAKLKEVGVPSTYEKFEGWPHTMDLAADVNARCVWFMDKFLAEHAPLP